MIEHVLVIDIEVSGERVREIGACLGEEQGCWTDLAQAEEDLRAMASRARGLAGHNAHEHDLPYLERLWPDHPLLRLPLVDTLLWSPLIRPERPYHRLVKDMALVRERGNDPLSDALGARALLVDVLAWQRAAPPALSAFARAAVRAHLGTARWAGPPRPPPAELLPALLAGFKDRGCASQAPLLTDWLCEDPAIAFPLACLAAWMPLGPGSVLPAWVWRRFPVVRELQTLLRETDCTRSDCAWCAANRSPEEQLSRWFPDYRSFRPEPALADGSSAQAAVVQAGLRDQSLFAVLPTGGGKSICFQVPAFARYVRTGALTVVISPLQSLMKDQVDALRDRTGNPHAFALHGGLDLLSRQEVLRAIREGDAGLLYLSPEQLRNPGARAALKGRQIGCWVFDEAHCMAEWGHDFRTDYWYAPRFIAELAAEQKVSIPAIACFTATAQASVRRQIEARIEETCKRSLLSFQAVTERSNISLRVLGTQPRQRQAQLQELLEEEHPPTAPGAAIVFCPRRRDCEELARTLTEQGWRAGAYHAGLPPQERREIQERFLGSSLQIIAATSAFGMGVDKPDVRLVAHLSMPPSLEDYVQQVGRAGRDGAAAQAVLLWHEDDLDRTLSEVRRSSLKRAEVEKVRQVVRKSARRGRTELTVGELSRLAQGAAEQGERVLASLSWLERAGLLRRDENRPRVFQGRPRIRKVEEARALLGREGLPPAQVEAALALLSEIWTRPEAQGGLDSDDLAERLGLRGPEGGAVGAGRQVIELLDRMVSAGLLDPGTLLRALVRKGIARDSTSLLEAASGLEARLLDLLSEAAPDAGGVESLDLGALSRELPGVSPAEVRAVLRQSAADRDEQGRPLLSLAARGSRRLDLVLRAPWSAVLERSRRRRAAASVALELLLGRAKGAGKDVGVDFALEEVSAALRQDLQLRAGPVEAFTLAERAVLSLHELGVIALQGGLAVFRSSMTLALLGRKQYTVADHRPAEEHHKARQRQAQAMGHYAALGMADAAMGAQVIREWFSAEGTGKMLAQLGSGSVTARTRKRILDPLDEDQRAVVEVEPDADLVVLAGPGSGKTRTLVHRVAWLVRAHGLDPRRILVLCYNRGTVAELRHRLVELLGEDGHRVPVSTLHALAMRLCGEGPRGRGDSPPDFEAILRTAVELLRSDSPRIGLPEGSARELLLAEWDTLLVDEVQDVDPLQAELLDALIGRRGEEALGHRMAVFAVGDDDQNIYSWRGARGDYLREFEQRYEATRHLLRFNHRSGASIVALCNAVAAELPGRLKEEPILAAEGSPPYGEPVREASVEDDAHALGEVRAQVQRWLAAGLEPSQIAVLARHHRVLWPLHDELLAYGIPCCTPPLKDPPDPWLLRETRTLLEALPSGGSVMRVGDLHRALQQGRALDPESRWWAWLEERCRDWEVEVGEAPFRALDLREYLREVIRDSRHLGSFGAGVVLSTQHGAKGLEWPAVIVLGDGDERDVDEAAERRLAYVALSRARQHLHLVRWRGSRPPWVGAGAREHTSTAAPGLLRRRRRELWNLDRLYLGFAGRQDPDARVHEALRTIPMGARLDLDDDGERAYLLSQGLRIAALSAKGRKAWARRSGELRLFAMVERRREQEDPKYAAGLRVERWWVPVLEWTEEAE